MPREHRSERGIKDSLKALERGDLIQYEAGGWRRKTPLIVDTEPDQLSEEFIIGLRSKRGSSYAIFVPFDRDEPAYDKEYGEVTWVRVEPQEYPPWGDYQ
jgi:hypothetical protein